MRITVKLNLNYWLHIWMHFWPRNISEFESLFCCSFHNLFRSPSLKSICHRFTESFKLEKSYKIIFPTFNLQLRMTILMQRVFNIFLFLLFFCISFITPITLQSDVKHINIIKIVVSLNHGHVLFWQKLLFRYLLWWK